MRAIITILVSVFCLSVAIEVNAQDYLEFSTQVIDNNNGVRASCAQIFNSKQEHFDLSSTYFGAKVSEWNNADVQFMHYRLVTCQSETIQRHYIKTNKEFDDDPLDMMSQKINKRLNEINAVNTKAREEAERQERKRLVKIKDDEKTAEAERQAAIDACHLTPAYRLYDAQDQIVGSIEYKESLLAERAQERRIVATSGVRNLAVERRIGEDLVQNEDNIKTYFAEYRRLGGKASSPNKVKRASTGPCF